MDGLALALNSSGLFTYHTLDHEQPYKKGSSGNLFISLFIWRESKRTYILTRDLNGTPAELYYFFFPLQKA